MLLTGCAEDTGLDYYSFLCSSDNLLLVFSLLVNTSFSVLVPLPLLIMRLLFYGFLYISISFSYFFFHIFTFCAQD